MNQELIPYKFKENLVNAIIDDRGEPWLIAKDVCNALGLSNVSKACANLDIDEKATITISNSQPGSGAQSMVIISEPGLYKLTLRSKKPEAKEFQRWAAHNVFPSIRKTGSYSLAPKTDLHILKQAVEALIDQQERLNAMESRMDTYESKQQTITAVLAPVKEVSTRMKISQIVRGYAEKNAKDFKKCWDYLYYQFKYRYSVDLTQRAKNNNKGRLDIAEELNCLDDLFALAVSLFVS